MNNHTPKPWRVGTGNTVVADSAEGTHSQPDNVEHYGGCLVAESIRTEANARLIAASPEMLDALETAEAWLSEFNDNDRFARPLAEVQTAIKKARGV